MLKDRVYISIDLKSFYASVECRERGLDPLTTNLVVADESRTEKTICLAVSPLLKAYGIPGRPRLFEVIQKVREINARRLSHAPGRSFSGSSNNDTDLRSCPNLSLDYIVARPRMGHYIEYSTRIYNVYLKYIAPEDIHVYSIDEVMIDATDYLDARKLTARGLASRMIRDVLDTVGITAVAGIGTNLYLSKVAMDILAKHAQPDENGIRIADLDEMSYRRLLWDHRPLTNFWRVGHGYAAKLEAYSLFTMGDIARCSLGRPEDCHNEDLLYRLFGINAELLIDHAWGWEPCTMADVKGYKPDEKSVGNGQVLPSAYPYEKARLIAREMTDLLALDLVDKKLVTDQLVLTLGYDAENLKDPAIRKVYRGEVTTDHYGRSNPKHAHGTANLDGPTSSARLLMDAVTALFERIADQNLLVKRVNVTANHVVDEHEPKAVQAHAVLQLDLFTDYAAAQAQREGEKAMREREKKTQLAMLTIKNKLGKNAIIKGMNLQQGATAMDRNRQIGGHKE